MIIEILANVTLVSIAVALLLLIIPARLLHLKTLEPYRPQHLWLARQGKWLGLAVAVLMLLHALTVEEHWQWSSATILLSGCLLILAVLTVISNKWSYAHLKYWKHLNMIIWLVVPFVAVYAVIARPLFNTLVVGVTVSLLAACAIACVSGLFEPKPGYFARHRVWLMGSGLMAALAIAWLVPA